MLEQVSDSSAATSCLPISKAKVRHDLLLNYSRHQQCGGHGHIKVIKRVALKGWKPSVFLMAAFFFFLVQGFQLPVLHYRVYLRLSLDAAGDGGERELTRRPQHEVCCLDPASQPLNKMGGNVAFYAKSSKDFHPQMKFNTKLYIVVLCICFL